MNAFFGPTWASSKVGGVGRSLVVACLLAVTVTACGGGGSGGPTPSGSSGTGGAGSGGSGTGGTGSGGSTSGGSGSGGGSGSSGSGGSSGGTGSGGAATALPVVYIADEDQDETWELYVVDANQPGVSVKLNAPLVANGDVDEFWISPTNAAVAYLADQDIEGRYELYLVNLAAPGTSVKLNTPLTVNRDVFDATFSADGTKIAYRADQDIDGIIELYTVGTGTPGASIKVSAPQAAGGDVESGFMFSPAGTHVLYRADQDQLDMHELYVVDLNVPGISMQVNPVLVTGGTVSSVYTYSPDGAQIGYIAEQETQGMRELFSVVPTQLGISTKVSGSLIPDGDVCRFEFSPDSKRVAYCADEDTDGVLELYTVDLGAPGVSVKLNAPLPAGGEVSSAYEFGQDSTFVVFIAEQDADDVDELYRVDIAAPGLVTKLNGALTLEGDVNYFEIRPDSTHVAYIADQDVDGKDELYEVALATAGVSTKLTPPQAGDGVYDLLYAPDSTRIYYFAAQDSTAYELYRLDLVPPAAPAKLNGTLVAGGEVWSYRLAF